MARQDPTDLEIRVAEMLVDNLREGFPTDLAAGGICNILQQHPGVIRTTPTIQATQWRADLFDVKRRRQGTPTEVRNAPRYARGALDFAWELCGQDRSRIHDE